MKTSIKTIRLPLITPKKAVQRDLDQLFKNFRYIYDETAKRMPSLPRKRVGYAKASTYYEWVKELNAESNLFSQVAQAAGQKARENYAAMLGNKVYNVISRSSRNVAQFHNQCFKIEHFGNMYFLNLPIKGGWKNNRVILPFKPNEYSDKFLQQIVSTKLAHGTGELKKYGDDYWFNLTVKTPVEINEKVTPVGIDMGLTNIAVACAFSEGKTHVKLWSGKGARHKRRLFLDRIASLQSKSHLKEVKFVKNKYRDYMMGENHRISREIVNFASGFFKPYIVLENLHQFRKQNDWTFAELRTFIEYKALESGIPVVAVNPKNTSNTCNKCGYTDGKNRNGTIFRCLECGYEVNADVNAAINLSRKGQF